MILLYWFYLLLMISRPVFIFLSDGRKTTETKDVFSKLRDFHLILFSFASRPAYCTAYEEHAILTDTKQVLQWLSLRIFLKFSQNFLSKARLKKFLIDNNYKTFFVSVRIVCSSCTLYCYHRQTNWVLRSSLFSRINYEWHRKHCVEGYISEEKNYYCY